MINGRVDYNGTYQLLLNNILGLEIIPGVRGPLSEVAVRALTSNEEPLTSTTVNLGWQRNHARDPRPMGQFNLSIEACAEQLPPTDGGRVVFVADGSALINAMYDYEGFNEGKYGPTGTMMPSNDDRKWALDFIAEALMNGVLMKRVNGRNAMVIFDGSATHRAHWRPTPTTPSTSCSSTSQEKDWRCSFPSFCSSLSKPCSSRSETQAWRPCSASSTTALVMRIATLTTPKWKNPTVFLSKVRNLNGLNREEFQAMKANELVSMINDRFLAKFAVESNNKYTLEQTVALVKRIKAWGRQ